MEICLATASCGVLRSYGSALKSLAICHYGAGMISRSSLCIKYLGLLQLSATVCILWCSRER